MFAILLSMLRSNSRKHVNCLHTFKDVHRFFPISARPWPLNSLARSFFFPTFFLFFGASPPPIIDANLVS